MVRYLFQRKDPGTLTLPRHFEPHVVFEQPRTFFFEKASSFNGWIGERQWIVRYGLAELIFVKHRNVTVSSFKPMDGAPGIWFLLCRVKWSYGGD